MSFNLTFVGTPAATREEWLQRAADLMAEEFRACLADSEDEGISALTNGRFPKIRISCGYPVNKRGGSGIHAVGQCWHPSVSADGATEIFITPEYGGDKIAGQFGVGDTLLHELIHAIVGVEEGHTGRFKTVALALGFLPPMTSTPVDRETLGWWLDFLEARIGPYPHGAMHVFSKASGGGLLPGVKPDLPPILVDGPKPQGKRQRKVECGTCGCIVRMTAGARDRAGGYPHCACGAGEMTPDEGDWGDDA